MSAVDIEQLHQETASIVRRVRDRHETIEISDRGEVIAQLTPVEPMPVSLASTSEPEVDDPDAKHAAIWAELTRLGQELSKTWPEGLSAVDAIREQRRY